jgi:hypothetical protein
MAVTDLEGVATGTADAEALFREARQRRRRRRLALALSLTLAAAGIGIGLGLTQGGDPSPPTSASAFSRVVVSSTRSARTATMSFTYRDTSVGGCIPDTNAPISSGSGVVDYVQHATSTTMTTRGCQDLTPSWLENYQTKMIQVGGETFQTQPPGHGSPTSNTRPWLVIEAAPGPEPSLDSILTSPHMLDVLSALQGTVEPSGSVVLHGENVTKYAAHMTLASIYSTVSGGAPSQSVFGAPLVPAARSIVIPVTLWIDGANRLIRLQASEPLYTAVYADGSDTEGAAQAPARGGLSEALGIRRLRQQSSLLVRIDLSNFGTAVNVSPPPPSKIAYVPPPQTSNPLGAAISECPVCIARSEGAK